MSYFTDKLLRVVRDVQRHINARRRDEDDPDTQLSREFPKLAGSHLAMSDPALEFIKQVCAVLALDNRVQHNIMVRDHFAILVIVIYEDLSPRCCCL